LSCSVEAKIFSLCFNLEKETVLQYALSKKRNLFIHAMNTTAGDDLGGRMLLSKLAHWSSG
jgi:hypothetical protein